MAFKNFKKWLGMGLLAGSLAMPTISRADDYINFGVSYGAGQGSTIATSHNDYGEEGFDVFDDSNPPSNPNSKWVKMNIDSYESLSVDNRNNTSSTSFNLGIEGVSTGESINGTINLSYNAIGGWDQTKIGGIFTGVVFAAYTTNNQEIIIHKVIDGSTTSGSLGSYGITNVNNGDRFFIGAFLPGAKEKTSTTNGIPYSWLTQYGITNKTDSVETNDADVDGVNNLDEYIADTNPTNANSRFAVGLTASGNQIVLGINPSSTGRVYGVETKTNLMDSVWDPATNNIYGNGSNLEIRVSGDADRKFYRAKVGLP